MSDRANHPVHAVSPQWSGAALASAILGVLGFASLWLGVGLFLAAAGAVCGHVGRHRVARPGHPRLRGRTTAGFGMAVSYFTMLLFPLLVAGAMAALPMIEDWRAEKSEARREASRSQAAELFAACEAYARANDDVYPANWGALSGRYLPESELRRLLRSPHPGGEELAFELISHDRPVLPSVSDGVVVIQEIAPAEVERSVVVSADGKVKSILNPNRH